MPLSLCILASGSAGNCTWVSSESTAVLIDAGLSVKQTEARLSQIGEDLSRVKAVCLSHEHGDHVGGLAVLHNRHRIPVYANAATAGALASDEKHRSLDWRIFTTGSPFKVGDLTLEPFNVPHDALDPVGYLVSSGGTRVGVVTDLGAVTTLVRLRLRDCHAIVLESNHDELMLQRSDRPWSLKQRILGRQGHLSNQHAADLLAEIAGPNLRQVYLAHLSSDCNQPEAAQGCVRRALDQAGWSSVAVEVCKQDKISSRWSDLPAVKP